MQADQRKRNEFLIDLAEFVEKHFQINKNRTRIREDDGAASVRILNEAVGSELEMAAAGPGIVFRFAGAEWPIEGHADTNDLFVRTIRDLVDVLSDRKTVLRGSRQGSLIACRVAETSAESEAIQDFLDAHAGCDNLTRKRWNAFETGYPLKSLEK